ncbi:sigma factor-like helix-turn-helix DNA-binding protein [Streptomyces sp. NPDC002870]|uniref:sigma factor-like helix-turn-helix DNA-binding protein n=1 Tax=Streptomyces sp. NPDC002870 TaxID=3364666 RepID=UPI0036C40062
MTQSTTRSVHPPLPSPMERRRRREAKFLSEEEAATVIGVTRATIRSWETGRTSPRGRNRELYARLLADPAERIREYGDSGEYGGSGEYRDSAEYGDSWEYGDPWEYGALSTRQCENPAERTAERPTVPADPAPPHPDLPGSPAPAAREAPPPKPPEEPALPEFTPAEAFDALYEFAAPALVRQTYLLTGRLRLSHESVERAFHLAWQQWPKVAVDRDPAGWVRAAAYEYAISPWQRLRPAHRHPDAPRVERDPHRLLDALQELPPSYRHTLLLYDGLGLDLPETAAETEASTPAAANRLMHARAALAERVPEVGVPETLHEQLTALADACPVPRLSSAGAVRTGCERRARFWTRTAITVTTLIIGATAYTLATAPTRYEPPIAPGQQVGGVPPHSGPQLLTPRVVELRAKLLAEPAYGPERLLPQER